MEVTDLAKLGVPAAFVAPLSAALEHYFINTPARVAGFVAQCRVETRDFTVLVEDLYYTHADHIHAVFPREVPSVAAAAALVARPQVLANTVYANRMGNGDQFTGDGWTFRGRGPGQLTGRKAYTAAGLALDRPYVAQPDLVAQPADGCLVAAWNWWINGCNALADSHAWDGITRLWNGPGMERAADRAALSNQLLKELSS